MTRLLLCLSIAGGLMLSTVSAESASAAKRQGTDRDAGIRFILRNRVLTVKLLATAPRRVRRQILGNRIRATCTRYVPVVKVTAIHSWPSSASATRYRFRRNISRRVAWCLLEKRNGDDVAFANLRP